MCSIRRPPGHHAMRSEASGYCFFNNAAIAAKYAIDRLGMKRVLVVDWDLHHGQGTQYMFYDDPRYIVLYCLLNNVLIAAAQEPSNY